MSDYHLSQAKKHDNPHLIIDERYIGMGLLFDLGYMSFERIRACNSHNAKFVQRLKENWKPKVDRITWGEVNGEFVSGADFDELLLDEVIVLILLNQRIQSISETLT